MSKLPQVSAQEVADWKVGVTRWFMKSSLFHSDLLTDHEPARAHPGRCGGRITPG